MKKKYFLLILIISGFIFFSCKRSSTDNEYIKRVELNEETTAVGIYNAPGIDYPNNKYIAEAINIDGGVVYVTLTDDKILKTKLENIDVVIFPFTNGSQLNKLDDKIASIFQDFVLKQGKGIIGYSNGSLVLSANSENQSLGLIDVDFLETADDYEGLKEFKLAGEGFNMFPELEDYNQFYISYKNDVKIVVNDTANINIIAESSEPLILTAKSGKGKIVIINANPEITPGMRWMLPRLIRWTVNKDFIWYDKNVFRPGVYQHEINLVGEAGEKIEKLKSKLDAGKKDEVLTAMDELQSLYPWKAAEKVRSLLIEKNDEIKLKAAKYLVDIEYTLAVDDLNKLIRKEHSRKVKEQLIIYRNQLADMMEQN